MTILKAIKNLFKTEYYPSEMELFLSSKTPEEIKKIFYFLISKSKFVTITKNEKKETLPELPPIIKEFFQQFISFKYDNMNTFLFSHDCFELTEELEDIMSQMIVIGGDLEMRILTLKDIDLLIYEDTIAYDLDLKNINQEEIRKDPGNNIYYFISEIIIENEYQDIKEAIEMLNELLAKDI